MAEEGKKDEGFYAKVRGMAEELGLEGDDKDNFINQAMEKKGGHKKVTTWIPEGESKKEGKSGSNWF